MAFCLLMGCFGASTERFSIEREILPAFAVSFSPDIAAPMIRSRAAMPFAMRVSGPENAYEHGVCGAFSVRFQSVFNIPQRLNLSLRNGSVFALSFHFPDGVKC